METRSLPEMIRTIIAQAGGLGLAGAFTYVGASQFTYRCPQAEGEYRSSRPSRLVSEAGLGFVDYEVRLQARVNGKHGRGWTLTNPTTPTRSDWSRCVRGGRPTPWSWPVTGTFAATFFNR
jgi:hypothetical protein